MKESAESPFRPKSSRDFTNSKLTSFPQLPSSVYYDQITISSPNITSFQNYSNLLKSPSGNTPSLVYLKLNNTGIATYKGAVKTPSLKYIFLANTPLSRYHFYRVMTIIVFGPETLEEIDHIPIKKSERAFSLKNFEVLYPYLVDGWLLTMVDPIRIFDPVTRRRRILYPLPDRRKTISSSLASSIKKSMDQQPVSDKKTTESKSSSQQKTLSKDGTDFLNLLEKIFFENNLNELFESNSPKKKNSLISELKSILSKSNDEANDHELIDSDASLFVNFVLRAAALRPLNVDSIARLLKEVLTDEILDVLKLSLFQTNFYSNSALANFIESLLDQSVFTTEDVKPLFFSIYERFEDWNSPFSLTTAENDETNGLRLLTVPFIDFFCPFSSIIERVDSDLYNSLLDQASDEEKEKILTYRTNDEKKREIWSSLASDDYSKFYPTSKSETENNKNQNNNNIDSENDNKENDDDNTEVIIEEEEEDEDPVLFTKEQLKQCVIDLTPWDVKEQQIEVAFAFSGSPQCLFHSSLFNDNDDEQAYSSDLLKAASVAGGCFEIFSRINNDTENGLELAENAIRFHRFEMLKEVSKTMNDESSDLSSLIEVAVDSMEVNAINFIVKEKKVKISKEMNASLLNRAILSSVHITNSDLDQTSKSRFVNPLNSLLSGSLTLQKPFVVFLYKIGFRSQDSLIFSIQSQSLSLVRFFISQESKINSDFASKSDIQKKLTSLINRRGWDHLRWTPLHVAANIGNVEIIKELMKINGINVNLRDTDGNTPLMIAVSNNFDEVVRELLNGKSKQKRAKSLQRPNQLTNKTNLLSVVDPNIADKYGWTPILVAIGNKNVSIVKQLLDYNKNGKFVDINQAAISGQKEIKSMMMKSLLMMKMKMQTQTTALVLLLRLEVE